MAQARVISSVTPSRPSVLHFHSPGAFPFEVDSLAALGDEAGLSVIGVEREALEVVGARRVATVASAVVHHLDDALPSTFSVLAWYVPARSGVAKQEATTMANYLVRHGHAVIETDAATKNAKRLRLTDSGNAASTAYRDGVSHWSPNQLRRSLEAIPTDVSDLHTNGGWRQQVKAPDTLPHFPVVTGHGGYPDGS